MTDVLIVLGAGVAGMAAVAYELAGLTVPGWHTISYSAQRSWLLRIIILAGILASAAWWWLHTAGLTAVR